MALPAKIRAATYCKPTFSWKGRRSGPGGRGRSPPEKAFFLGAGGWIPAWGRERVRMALPARGGLFPRRGRLDPGMGEGAAPPPPLAPPDKAREAADCGPAFCLQGRRVAGARRAPASIALPVRPRNPGSVRAPRPPDPPRPRPGLPGRGRSGPRPPFPFSCPAAPPSPTAGRRVRAAGDRRAGRSARGAGGGAGRVFGGVRSPVPDGGPKGSGGRRPSCGAERPPCAEGRKGSGVSAGRAAVAPLPAQDFPAGSSRKFSGNFRKNFPENFPAFFSRGFPDRPGGPAGRRGPGA